MILKRLTQCMSYYRVWVVVRSCLECGLTMTLARGRHHPRAPPSAAPHSPPTQSWRLPAWRCGGWDQRKWTQMRRWVSAEYYREDKSLLANVNVVSDSIKHREMWLLLQSHWWKLYCNSLQPLQYFGPVIHGNHSCPVLHLVRRREHEAREVPWTRTRTPEPC